MMQGRFQALANIPAPGPPFHIVTGRVGTACQPSGLYTRAPPAGRGAIYLALLTKKGAAKPRPYLSSVIRTLYSYFNTFAPLHRSSAPICTFALAPFTSLDSSLDSFLDSVLYSSRVQTSPPRLRFDPLGPGRDR